MHPGKPTQKVILLLWTQITDDWVPSAHFTLLQIPANAFLLRQNQTRHLGTSRLPKLMTVNMRQARKIASLVPYISFVSNSWSNFRYKDSFRIFLKVANSA